MSIYTKTFRDHYKNIVCKSTFDFILNEKQARLRISTSKSNQGFLSTSASVCWPEQHEGYQSETFMLFQDFGKVLVKTKPARITEKAVDTQHQQVLAGFAEILASAKAFYGISEGSEASEAVLAPTPSTQAETSLPAPFKPLAEAFAGFDKTSLSSSEV